MRSCAACSKVSSKYRGNWGELARYLLSHSNELALGTVASLARDAAAHPSALVRLAQRLGFSGFSELQGVLRAALAETAPSYQERVRQRSSGTGGLLRQACGLKEVSLQHLADTDQGLVDRAASLLAGARAVHVIGQRRSHAVAVHLAYSLTRAGKLSRVLSGAGGFLHEEAATMQPRDVLLAVSMYPYSAEVIEVCMVAQARGITVVALTDGPLSPLAPLATVAFELQDADFAGFHSPVPHMCLSQALVFGVVTAIAGTR
jgi:DNA-binding MurR/RpiR family transcriptional regulator